VAATRSCGRRRWRSMAFSREKRDCRVLLPCRSKPPTAAVEQLGIATGRGGECIGSSKESFASTVSTAWTAPTSPNRSAHCAGGEGYVCGTALALAHCIPELALTHASLFSRMAALACLDSRAGMSPHALVSTRPCLHTLLTRVLPWTRHMQLTPHKQHGRCWHFGWL
jgi:hypothetical protein